MVDIVSNGCFDFGVGSGYQLHEFAGLGVDIDDRTSLFLESLDILNRIWEAARLPTRDSITPK